MGWFSKRAPEPEPVFDEVRPISQERLGLLFDSQEWVWEIDSEGDLGGNWGGNAFFFRFSGKQHEVLNIVAFSARVVAPEHEADLLIHVEDWNRDHLWPKAYFRRGDEGLRVMGEVNVDYEFGATDAQLLQQCHCALSTTLQFFDSVAERFGVGEQG
ncbi:YbjN domain-containing protein [Actinomyces sp. B33]|uniref:YbjN domain-containing protein n=1 Tax=Actinomyces sp. B33 TaxID=2942131 RepID=UPI0023422A9F|nr:YbjN domain-containing protein [Actinomyces sp. B33]MDC4232257.1 YbjN domain-containing protein [Actinomyces sp. B33]